MKIGNTDISKLYIGSTEVTKVYLGSTVVYEPIDYRTLPLTFEIQSDGEIKWEARDGYTEVKTIEYSKNGGEWTSITSASGSSAPSISVVSGDTVQFRGNNIQINSSTSKYNKFTLNSVNFKIYGNIASLLYLTTFSTKNTYPYGYGNTFSNLFRDCTGLTDASNLVLPATTLESNQDCYAYMFNGCSSLTTAPELPATTLAEWCYERMFADCTSLVSAPELPATTLTNNCYQQMFQGCTSLTTAPELPATVLTNNCYYCMFQGCSSLTTAPELPAPTLTQGCYQQMFNGCTSLNYIKCLATDISATNCTYYWLSVDSTGTFVTPASTNWTTGGSGIPTNWTRVNA